MKRCLALIIITVGICTGMRIYADEVAKPRVFEVNTVLPEIEGIVNSVSCKGNIEEERSKSLYVSESATVTDVSVVVGDKVKSGQPLLEASYKAGVVIPPADEALSVFAESIGVDKNIILEKLTENPELSQIYDKLLPGIPVSSFEEPEKTEVLRAPFEGVVTRVVNKGDATSPALPCVTISDLSKLMLRASVSERYISDISIGQRAVISGDGFDGMEYSGTVVKMMPFAHSTGTLIDQGEVVVDVLISIDKPDEHLLPGFTGFAKIYTGSKDNALIIPYGAITEDESGNECVFVDIGGKAVKRLVTTGLELEESIEILSGVEKSEKVILNPPAGLFTGAVLSSAEE